MVCEPLYEVSEKEAEIRGIKWLIDKKMVDMKENVSEQAFWFKEGEVDSLWKFVLAINWKERWLICLMLFHLFCSLLVFLSRKSTNVQTVIFCILCGSALASEKLNELGARHWKIFAKEQYFDSNGQFISIVWSLPIMINCLLLVIIWLVNVGDLLIKTKRRQLLRVQGNKDTDTLKSKKTN